MKSSKRKYLQLTGLGLVTGLVALWFPLHPAPAQWPYAPPPTTPDAQRNTLNDVQAQARWLQNTTRTASNFRTGALEMVWEQFQKLRGAYTTFKSTLNPRQLGDGANDLAELEAGLDILQEAFGNYQQDVAAGQSPATAFQNMCRVLGRATAVWLQEFNKDASRLRVGWN